MVVKHTDTQENCGKNRSRKTGLIKSSPSKSSESTFNVSMLLSTASLLGLFPYLYIPITVISQGCHIHCLDSTNTML